MLFGFSSKQEREMFRLLISVSGIGANTGRVILSSLSPAELRNAILESNVNALKKVKGIGLKTAQRVIIDLKDKVGKTSGDDGFLISQSNTLKEEALSALVMLGFAKAAAGKAIDTILAKNNHLSVEELVKKSLKGL